MTTCTFPQMGDYNTAFKHLAEGLGYDVILPGRTTQETIKLGVRHSSSMVCFPFKTTLGNLIQGLEAGAEVILATDLMDDSRPELCRFGFYFRIQEQILRRLGYKFDMIYLKWEPRKLLGAMCKMNKKLNYITAWKLLRKTYLECKEIEKKIYAYTPSDINIGIVGEAFTLWEGGVNYDMVSKLRKLNCGVHMSINLSWFIRHELHLEKYDKKIVEETKKYLPKRTGGHGFESVYHLIKYAKEGFDGVIHLTPLSCMPETLVEMPMNFVSEDYNIPILRFPIDENQFEAGVQTRLETFVKLLRRKKHALLRN